MKEESRVLLLVSQSGRPEFNFQSMLDHNSGVPEARKMFQTILESRRQEL